MVFHNYEYKVSPYGLSSATKSTIPLACCAVGGYVDNKLNALLDLDGLEESVVSMIAIGKREKK